MHVVEKCASLQILHESDKAPNLINRRGPTMHCCKFTVMPLQNIIVQTKQTTQQNFWSIEYLDGAKIFFQMRFKIPFGNKMGLDLGSIFYVKQKIRTTQKHNIWGCKWNFQREYFRDVYINKICGYIICRQCPYLPGSSNRFI